MPGASSAARPGPSPVGRHATSRPSGEPYLGFALAQGLSERLDTGDVVYLTGPDPARVAAARKTVMAARAEVHGAVVDVSEPGAVARFAASLAERHGGVDIVFSNHYTRIQPDDDPAEMIDRYVAVNNLGTTNVLRAFAPLLRDGARLLVVASRAGSLRALAPVLHARFDGGLESLADVDSAVCTWRDAVREGRAAGEAWPAWINIPPRPVASGPSLPAHATRITVIR